MDDVDSANDKVLFTTEAAIKLAAHALPEALATGECLHCTEPVVEARRWCDAVCRDAWEKEKRYGKQR